MLTQAMDFRDESEALYEIVAPINEADFRKKTLFKDWTVHDVIAHLHMWNWAADASLRDEAEFMAFSKKIMGEMRKGRSFTDVTDQWLGTLRDRPLLETWRGFYREMAERFAEADPKRRVKWAGPEMSVRSSITARLMETWAHGQELYDLLGLERADKDRIKNIAILGINTFGWTFRNRGLDAPSDIPYVKLHAPSGAVWEWNEKNDANFIEGRATEFCQVVTQTRSIADTKLTVIGETAARWMSIAQCFAGPPEDPPAPGSRRRQQSS